MNINPFTTPEMMIYELAQAIRDDLQDSIDGLFTSTSRLDAFLNQYFMYKQLKINLVQSDDTPETGEDVTRQTGFGD
jgi:hypothetical protein